jgi:hypothetical protein
VSDTEELQMTLTLIKLLEVNENLLRDEEKTGAKLGEYLWTKNGEPKTIAMLIRLLDTIIEESRRVKIIYPKIFLKRKKELERGTWKPCATKIIGIDGKSVAESIVAT